MNEELLYSYREKRRDAKRGKQKMGDRLPYDTLRHLYAVRRRFIQINPLMYSINKVSRKLSAPMPIVRIISDVILEKAIVRRIFYRVLPVLRKFIHWMYMEYRDKPQVEETV